jgi:hypothetical protein
MHEIWKKKNLNVKTYTPEKKLEFNKEQVLPLLNYTGTKIAQHRQGLFSIFINGLLASIRGFFKAKDKIRRVSMEQEKVLDLRMQR